MRKTEAVCRFRDATGTAYARDAGASPDGCHAIDVTAATAAHRIADLSSQPSLTWDILMEGRRSEEHTSELQSLMRIPYAVFCLQKKRGHTHSDQVLVTNSHASFLLTRKT